MDKRSVFFISDGTAITAETLGHSLITQFENIQFNPIRIPYIDSEAKAQEAVERINQTAAADNCRPLVFTTFINKEIRDVIETGNGKVMDLLQVFLAPLEKELKTKSSYTIGRTHGMADFNAYKTRIDAVNYALNNDDGTGIHNYDLADLILVGVSRCGKTPTCLYLALHFGLRAANYPFTEDDMQDLKLPDFLSRYHNKIFGLTINTDRLHAIRSERRPNSRYASREQCRLEIKKVINLFEKEKIPYLDTTSHSIEEISTKILAATGLERKIY